VTPSVGPTGLEPMTPAV